MGIVRWKLQDTETGVVREGETPSYGSNREQLEFQWLENNYSCDCNRALFFARAAGEPDPEREGCSDSRYHLLELTLDGEPCEVDD